MQLTANHARNVTHVAQPADRFYALSPYSTSFVRHKNPLRRFRFRADKIKSENSEMDQLSATGGLDIGGYLLADLA